MFVYTISNFCNGYTHDLGSTWELGSGFATSFYLSASLVKNKLKVQSNFIELLLIVIPFTKIPAIYGYIFRDVHLAPRADLFVAKIVDNAMISCAFN
ncbi:MAG: hypothetical protein V7K25_03735 [Nostoc sp.]